MRITETTHGAIAGMMNEYVQTIAGWNDDYWEEHILEAAPRVIEDTDGTLGFAALRGDCVTALYLPRRAWRRAQDAFDLLLRTYAPRCALVSTGDELFLSLCMDRQVVVDKQAYFFTLGGAPARLPEYPRKWLRPGTMDDLGDLLDEDAEENLRLGKYFVMRDPDGAFLGQGFYNDMTLLPDAASIGMSTHPDHRRKGVGRSIILHMADICRERGRVPVCGCWYYNHNSKRTLESAGFVTKRRYLRPWFTQKEDNS